MLKKPSKWSPPITWSPEKKHPRLNQQLLAATAQSNTAMSLI
jgi:hypothetical protein